MARILAGILCVLWALPCSAWAGTVTPREEYTADGVGIDIVDFAAAPGEANQLDVHPGTSGLLVHDAVPITPVAPCTAVDAQTASCPIRHSLIMHVTLGDGDDTFTTTLTALSVYITVDGGEGDDAIGAPGTIKGGPGNDRLTGESVEGGPGADVLQAPNIGYADHTEGVTIDMAGGLAGAPGENDQIVPVPGETSVVGGSGPDVIRMAGTHPSASGGPGDDVIEGSPAADDISGGAGNDTLRGNGGKDQVWGGAGGDHVEGGDGDDDLRGDSTGLGTDPDPDGDDVISGGAGNDKLSAGAGNDVLDGGAGRDTLVAGDGQDTLRAIDGERDTLDCGDDDTAVLDRFDVVGLCPNIHRSGPGRLEWLTLERAGARRVGLGVRCTQQHTCVGYVRVYAQRGIAHERVVGRLTFRVRAGGRGRIVVPVSVNTRRQWVGVHLRTRTGGDRAHYINA